MVTEGGSVPQSAEGAQQVLGVRLDKFELLFADAAELGSIELEPPPQALSVIRLNQKICRKGALRQRLMSLNTNIRKRYRGNFFTV